MDLPSEKRPRKQKSHSSSSDELQDEPPGENLLIQNSRNRRSEDPPVKLPQEEGLPMKRPKMFEYEMRKSASYLPSGISKSISCIQEAIQNNDFSALLRSLNLLSAELTMTNDELLSGLPIDSLTDILVFSLNAESAEIVLQSMICVNFLVDSHHSAITFFVKAGIVSLLTNKIMNIEYIDVAEYAVKSLEKISHEFPGEVLRKSFFSEILPMLDFFDQNVQKKMLGILLNVSKSPLTFEDFQSFLEPCLPVFLCFMQNKQKETLFKNEKTLEILVALIESLRSVNEDEQICLKLLEQGIILIILEVLNEFSNLTGKGFKLLASLCKASLKLTASFIETGFDLLSRSLEVSIFEGNSLILTEALQLVHSMMPSESDTRRQDFYTENSQPIFQLAQMILPKLSSIYEILNKRTTKVLLLEVTLTIIQLSSKEELSTLMHFSSFLSGLLLEKEGSVIKSCLKIISVLYNKIPEQVSETFTRQGIVHRVFALKDPENLKNIIDEKYSDSFEFEQFLLNYRRTRAMSDHHDLHIQRPRLLSECRDQTFDIKKEIIRLSKGLVEKHNSCENQSGFFVSNILKNIANGFVELKNDDAGELWRMLIDCLREHKPTAFELSSSNLANSIWNFLASKEKIRGGHQRIDQFLKVFQVGTSGKDFEMLLELFLSTFNYLDCHIVASPLKTHTRGYSSRLRVNLVYLFNDDLPDELQSRNEFFKRNSKFSISPDLNCSVSALKSLLKRIKTKEDLLYFKEAVRDEVMEVEDDSVKSINISLLMNDNELSNELSINDLHFSSSDTPTIKFKFSLSIERSNFLSKEIEILQNFLETCSKVGLDSENPAFPYLRFINFLFHCLSKNPFSIKHLSKPDLSKFICPKLNSLVSKQYGEHIHLARKILPSWMKELPRYSWFLFSYSTRLRILDNFRYFFQDFTRNPRQKVRVDRENIMEGARILANDRNLLMQGVLEVQFDEEIGTGNGPTLEFFSIVAENICKLPIWRKGNSLFPSPSLRPQSSEFFFIGRLVGKAILDKRYIELPFSPVFWKMVQQKPVSFVDLEEVDPDLHKFLCSLKEFLGEYEKNPLRDKYQGVDVEDLQLYFTLPAYEDVELLDGGKNKLVLLENLSEYIELVVEKTLVQQVQVNEFREGLCSLITLDSLLGFSADELEELICGSHNDVWDLETLQTCIKPAHGYSESSKIFQCLLKIMSEFDGPTQRKFLQFTTGCPRLPLGGFFGLNPCLTVVKKEEGDDSDKYLPSVMTCQNYLKLPNYSSEDILRKNLFFALEEGHQMFHLS
jgi:hypothetical protein